MIGACLRRKDYRRQEVAGGGKDGQDKGRSPSAGQREASESREGPRRIHRFVFGSMREHWGPDHVASGTVVRPQPSTAIEPRSSLTPSSSRRRFSIFTWTPAATTTASAANSSGAPPLSTVAASCPSGACLVFVTLAVILIEFLVVQIGAGEFRNLIVLRRQDPRQHFDHVSLPVRCRTTRAPRLWRRRQAATPGCALGSSIRNRSRRARRLEARQDTWPRACCSNDVVC